MKSPTSRPRSGTGRQAPTTSQRSAISQTCPPLEVARGFPRPLPCRWEAFPAGMHSEAEACHFPKRSHRPLQRLGHRTPRRLRLAQKLLSIEADTISNLANDSIRGDISSVTPGSIKKSHRKAFSKTIIVEGRRDTKSFERVKGMCWWTLERQS